MQIGRRKSQAISETGGESDRDENGYQNNDREINKYSVEETIGSIQVKEQISSESEEYHKAPKSSKDSRAIEELKQAQRVLLIRKDHRGSEKADFIKMSHFKIPEVKEGVALLIHRRTQKNHFVKIEKWEQGSKEGQRMITLREISINRVERKNSLNMRQQENHGREERKGRFYTVEEEEDVDESVILTK